MVVLETRAAAEARGVEILAAVRGYGMSSNGDGEMVAPSRDGSREAMRRALEHAGVRPEQIDYVNTHGTSTPVGDVVEVDAMRGLFDNRPVAYSSTKGYTGHAVSAAGVVETVFTAMMLRGSFIAPSIHAEPLDPALCDYPPVLAPTRRELSIAMTNSFGFGGTNVALILGR
jgi:3-oxoacyl-[acyl-carrier-protein] synthase-1